MSGSGADRATKTVGGRDDGSDAKSDASPLNPLSEAKLWKNPLVFSHGLNTTASFFNVPIYNWIEKKYGLTRPQFVVLFSVYLLDGSTANDICVSSVFPKNTISRAVMHAIRERLIESSADPLDNRRLLLRLTKAGRLIIEEVLPVLQRQEDLMLAALSKQERRTLESFLERIILHQGGHAPSEIAEQPQRRAK